MDRIQGAEWKREDGRRRTARQYKRVIARERANSGGKTERTRKKHSRREGYRGKRTNERISIIYTSVKYNNNNVPSSKCTQLNNDTIFASSLSVFLKYLLLLLWFFFSPDASFNAFSALPSSPLLPDTPYLHRVAQFYTKDSIKVYGYEE